MKLRHCLVLSAFLAGPSAIAAPLTWDSGDNSNGATIDAAGGIWDTSTGIPWNDAGVNVVWTQTSGTVPTNSAIFAGADGAYAIEVAAAVATSGLTFSNDGYTLSASSAQTLTNTGGIAVAAGDTAIIGSNITLGGAVGSNSITGGGTLKIVSGAIYNAGAATFQTSVVGTTVEVETGGTLTNNNSFFVGNTATAGVLKVTGGAVTVNGNLAIGTQNTNAAGIVTLSDGSISLPASTTNGVRMSAASGVTGNSSIFNLDGGTLTTGIIYENAANTGSNSTFNFHGGTLKANINSANFMTGLNNAIVKAGGAKIDTNSFNVTIGQALLHDSALGATPDGGLTKSSAGKLSLAGANTFTGGTTVSAGTLGIEANSTFAGGAVTSGAVGTGSLTLADGVTLDPGTAANRVLGASTFLVNGNVNIGTTATTRRLNLDGAINLGGGTRTLTLFKSTTATLALASGNEAFRLQQQSGGAAVSVADGTLRLVSDASVTTTFTAAKFDSVTTFTGNSGLVVGNRVIAFSQAINPFGTGANTGPKLTVEAGGYYNLNDGTGNNSYATSVYALSGGGTVTNLDGNGGIATLTVTGSDDTTFSGSLTDGANLNTPLGLATPANSLVALTHSGTGSLTLTGSNTYTGSTTLSGGSLILSGSGSITSPNIILGASTTFNVSAVAGGYTLASGQTLSGNGSLVGAANIAGTLSPGMSPGTLNTENQTWLNGGDYHWQVVDAEGTAGVGFDTVAVNGTLDLSNAGLTAGGFSINLWSLATAAPDADGDTMNFDATLNYSWALLTASGGITGFDSADFNINVAAANGAGGFTNALAGGGFSLHQVDNQLRLNFTAVPEPSSLLLGGIGGLFLLRRRRLVS